MAAYLEQYGDGLMGVLLTVGGILALAAIVAGILTIFSDDINEAIERWEK